MSQTKAEASLSLLIDNLNAQLRKLRAMSQANGNQDQTILGKFDKAMRTLDSIHELTARGEEGGDIKNLEERALRDFVNQIEERIEALAQQSADDVIAQRNKYTQSKKNSEQRSAESADPSTPATSS